MGRRVAGKVAIVTGGASGIGLASAELLAQEGASIVVADIDAEGADQVAENIRAGGGHAVAVPVDVSEPDLVKALMQSAIDKFGRIDILHNSAGSLAAYDGEQPVTGLRLDVWHHTLSVSLDGHLLGCRYAVPHMIAIGGGSIVNTVSMGAWAGHWATTGTDLAAGAIVSLTRSVATQYGAQGVRCNAVSPGLILTREVLSRRSPEDLDVIAQSNLLSRHGVPEDVANAVVFLASEEASFITGLILRIDGGHLAHLPHYAYLQAINGTTTGPINDRG